LATGVRPIRTRRFTPPSPTARHSLACSSLPPVAHPTCAAHSLLHSPAPRSSLRPCAALPTPSHSARHPLPQAKVGAVGGSARARACSRWIPPRRLESLGPVLSFPYVANICFKCFRGVLQLLHMDVVKVDRECFKRLFKIFYLFQTYVASIFYLDVAYVSYIYCKSMFESFSYFSLMLQSVFIFEVASVLSGCYICFTMVFKCFSYVFASVSNACCNSCIWIFQK